MIVIGLTGGIGMGKSTAAKMFVGMGIPMFSSDEMVHALMKKGEVISAIGRYFPGAVMDGKVDRQVLGKEVFADQRRLAVLEAILHPRVQEMQKSFIRRQRAMRRKIILLDIPLLFESGAHRRVDCVVTVTAPRWLQIQRVMKRHNMSHEKFVSIISRQLPDSERRKRADFVVHSGLGKPFTLKEIKILLRRAFPSLTPV